MRPAQIGSALYRCRPPSPLGSDLYCSCLCPVFRVDETLVLHSGISTSPTGQTRSAPSHRMNTVAVCALNRYAKSAVWHKGGPEGGLERARSSRFLSALSALLLLPLLQGPGLESPAGRQEEADYAPLIVRLLGNSEYSCEALGPSRSCKPTTLTRDQSIRPIL